MTAKKEESDFLYLRPEKRAVVLRAKELKRAGWEVKEIAEELDKSERTIFYMLNAPLSIQEQKIIVKEYDKKLEPVKDLGLPKRISQIREDANVIEFCESPSFLKMPLFPMQKIILKCFYGVGLEDSELEILGRLQNEGRTTWKKGQHYTELVLDIGMKAGKTALAGLIDCFEEYELYRDKNFREKYGLPKGKEVYIINVAVNAEQAEETIFAEVKARIENSHYYRLHAPYSSRAKMFRFPNEVIIKSGHSNSASLVGKTAKCVLFDELARFVEKGGKYSGDKVYYGLIRSVSPFKEDGKIISISSPLFNGDMITDLYNKSKEISSMLGFWLPTWEVNPKLPFDCEFLQNELKKNPEAFWRDYGAQPSLSQEAYYRIPEKIDEVMGKNLKHHAHLVDINGRLMPTIKGNPNFEYYVHADPSAKNDAYGLAMAHLENGKPIVDLAYRFLPQGGEIDLNEVEHFIEMVCQKFNVKQFSFDTWQATAISQMLARRGVESVNLFVDKSVHDRLKEQIYKGEIGLPPIEILAKELKGLVLLNGKKVDHPRTGSKDIADSVAGAVWFCLENPNTELAYFGKDFNDSDYAHIEIGGKYGFEGKVS